jgi:hypothetical protein
MTAHKRHHLCIKDTCKKSVHLLNKSENNYYIHIC